MKSNSFSENIDPLAFEVLDIVSDTAERMDIPLFIIGATARDFYFKSHRGTIDLDVGIHIASWNSFDTLFSELLDTGKFRKTGRVHRLLYAKNDFPIDILPFGALSNSEGIIKWSDNNELSTLGFEEAYRNSLHFT